MISVIRASSALLLHLLFDLLIGTAIFPSFIVITGWRYLGNRALRLNDLRTHELHLILQLLNLNIPFLKFLAEVKFQRFRRSLILRHYSLLCFEIFLVEQIYRKLKGCLLVLLVDTALRSLQVVLKSINLMG